MGRAQAITRTDHTAEGLRRLSSKCKDGAQVRRILALAMVLEGVCRKEAAENNGMDRQTLRDWVIRYNEKGIDGLISLQSPGRPRYLTPEQFAEFKSWVLAGPDPAVHGVVRWRCVDLQAEVARHFKITVGEQAISKWLHKLEMTRLQPRPVHPKKDPEREEDFKKTSKA
jgi:transposase